MLLSCDRADNTCLKQIQKLQDKFIELIKNDRIRANKQFYIAKCIVFYYGSLNNNNKK